MYDLKAVYESNEYNMLCNILKRQVPRTYIVIQGGQRLIWQSSNLQIESLVLHYHVVPSLD